MKNDNLLGLNIPENTDFVNIPTLVDTNAGIINDVHIKRAFENMADFAGANGFSYTASKNGDTWMEAVTMPNGGMFVKTTEKNGTSWNTKREYKASSTSSKTTISESTIYKNSDTEWKGGAR